MTKVKLETMIGVILLVILVIGGYLYFVSAKKCTGEFCALPLTGKDSDRKSAIIKITSTDEIKTLEDKIKAYKAAPEIVNASGFVNTGGQPINISEFRGKKVVLVDFWTYTCINCQRTLPYINDWYEKYRDEGLEIISIHTPEFAFEKLLKNVEKAATDFEIKYPIVLDNDYATWNAYGNQYWPRKYLIDIDGYIVYDHIGEGFYDETERAIQKALLERKERLNDNTSVTTTISDPENKIILDREKLGSPETYFGSSRNTYLSNAKANVSGIVTLTIPEDVKPNGLYLGGTWNITPEYAENKGEATIVYKYQAKNVYLVMSGTNGAEIEVTIDGKVPGVISGLDLNKGSGLGLISEERLYKIIEAKDYGEHTLIIKIKKGNVRAFAFTFG